MSEDRLQQIEQRLAFIERRIKVLKIDIKLERFEYLSDDIDSFRDETRKRLTRLEHGQNQIKASLDVILRHITGMGQE